MKDVYTNLIKVYTKKGDSGETGLFGGSRISKDSLKVEAYGSVDEAAAFIGEARSRLTNSDLAAILYKVQEKFLVIGAHLASDKKGINKLKENIEDKDIEELEKIIDDYSKQLLPLYKFIIPGDNEESAALHIARTVVRRSERRIVALKNTEDIDPRLLKYVNRVSDVLFVLSRIVEDNAKVKFISKAIMKNIDIKEKKLNLEVAKKVVLAGEEKGRELGLDFVITIVTKEGQLILEEKMDNAIFASIDVAFKKAYTAAALKMPTSALTELVKPSGSLYGLQNDSRYIVFGGGELLKINGEIVGAVGASGGTVEQDMAVAKACVEAFEKM